MLLPELTAGLVIALAYSGVLALLAVFGLQRLHIAWLALRARPEAPPDPSADAPPPRVLLQLPLYNEASVVEPLLASIAELDWPRDRLTVQVLDDSTDETVALVTAEVARLASAGLDIRHVRRPERVGFKAGALAYGLSLDDSPFVAIFDADFRPEPDFLERCLPWFAEPDLGLVQARWEHSNRHQSWLTELQALLLDAHFRVEQQARSASGRFFNFNGTAGVWRRAAIEAAGGWDGDTLTEDLDLSLRAQMIGWRFRYLNDVAAPAELPPTLAAFRGQQHRWAKGAGENLRKLLPALWRAPDLPLRARVEASFQLWMNLAYALVCLLALLAVPLVGIGLPISDLELTTDLIHLALVLAASGSVCLFYLAGQRARGLGAMVKALLRMPLLLAFGVGMAPSGAVAWLAGLMGRRSAFVRTPKQGDRRKVYRARRSLMPLVELALGLWLLLGIALALHHGRLLALPFLGLLASGLLGYGGLGLPDLVRASRSSPAPARAK